MKLDVEVHQMIEWLSGMAVLLGTSIYAYLRKTRTMIAQLQSTNDEMHRALGEKIAEMPTRDEVRTIVKSSTDLIIDRIHGVEQRSWRDQSQSGGRRKDDTA